MLRVASEPDGRQTLATRGPSKSSSPARHPPALRALQVRSPLQPPVPTAHVHLLRCS